MFRADIRVFDPIFLVQCISQLLAIRLIHGMEQTQGFFPEKGNLVNFNQVKSQPNHANSILLTIDCSYRVIGMKDQRHLVFVQCTSQCCTCYAFLGWVHHILKKEVVTRFFTWFSPSKYKHELLQWHFHLSPKQCFVTRQWPYVAKIVCGIAKAEEYLT